MLDFKPFSKTDWMGLAGAECFPNGSEPRIAPIEIDGFEASIVHDATGLTIIFEPESPGESELYLLSIDPEDGSSHPEDVDAALASLCPEVSSVALEALGFRTGAGGPFSVRDVVTAYEVADGAPYRV